MSKRFTDGYFALGLAVGIFSTVVLTIIVASGYDPDAQVADAINQGTNKTNQCGDGNDPVWGPWFGLCFGLYDSIAQWLMMAFTIVAAALLYGTLIQANRTNLAALNASNAALEANDIMRQEQRPWVTLIYDMQCNFFDRGGFQGEISWNYNFQNKGKSPAYDIQTTTKFIKGNGFIETLMGLNIDEFIDGCVRKSGRGGTPIIFPSEQTQRGKYSLYSMRAYERLKPVVEGDTFIFLACITYRMGLEPDAKVGVEARTFVITESKVTLGPWGHILTELPNYMVVR